MNDNFSMKSHTHTPLIAVLKQKEHIIKQFTKKKTITSKLDHPKHV